MGFESHIESMGFQLILTNAKMFKLELKSIYEFWALKERQLHSS